MRLQEGLGAYDPAGARCVDCILFGIMIHEDVPGMLVPRCASIATVGYMCHMRRRIHVSYEEEDTCVI